MLPTLPMAIASIEGPAAELALRTVRRRSAELANANDLDPAEKWVPQVLRTRIEGEVRVA